MRAKEPLGPNLPFRRGVEIGERQVMTNQFAKVEIGPLEIGLGKRDPLTVQPAIPKIKKFLNSHAELRAAGM